MKIFTIKILENFLKVFWIEPEKFKCVYCEFEARDRVSILNHVWSEHPGQVEEIESTDLETLIDTGPDFLVLVKILVYDVIFQKLT